MNRNENEAMAAILIVLGAFVLLAVWLFLGAWIALWLWNIIVIPIFGAPVLTYWQMYGLMWLVRLFVGSRPTTTTKKEN